MSIDAVFIFAAAACGFGLSLATYRFFAMRNDWPMGEWHRKRPGLPIAIGVVAVAWSIMIGIGRGGTSAWIIPLFGVLGAAMWTGVLKVGSQISLILAPVATVLLAFSWALVETPANRRSSMSPASVTGDTARLPSVMVTTPEKSAKERSRDK